MKRFAQTVIIVVAAALWAACLEIAPANQSANLPQNQNTKLTILKDKTPSSEANANVGGQISNISNGMTPDPETSTGISDISPNISAPIPNANLSGANVNLSNKTYDIVAVEKLIVPVEGIKREQLQDTFKAARSGGRVHDAIDIIAPQGAPVLAVADGEIARFFDSVRGGITIYQFSRDKKLIYYYGHLQRRADNLQPGQFVKQGTVIGYVGDTGNSGAGNFHLHFAIWAINDPKRYWDGTNINPYPLLR